MFENASLLILPSRAEPFGMIVLEAMQEGVPVICSNQTGALEELKTPLKFDINNPTEAAQAASKLLLDETAWQQKANEQLDEIKNYPARQYELRAKELWNNILRV